MYRIIGGSQKGRRIVAPKNFKLRPTTDYAKEGLFNILNNQYDFQSISVLDLFAGIGSISFEFCSRGVKDLIAVEKNYKHAQFIQETAEKLDFESNMQVINSDVLDYIERCTRNFTVLFADPPFDYDEKQYVTLVDTIFQKELVQEEGEFILEHNSKKDLSEISRFQHTRKYGNVSFSFFS